MKSFISIRHASTVPPIAWEYIEKAITRPVKETEEGIEEVEEGKEDFWGIYLCITAQGMRFKKINPSYWIADVPDKINAHNLVTVINSSINKSFKE